MRELYKRKEMVAVFGIPIAISIATIWWTERRRKQLVTAVVFFSEALEEHLEQHYQEKVDQMFHVLTEEIDPD